MSKRKSKTPRHKPLVMLIEVADAFQEMSGDARTCAVVGLSFVENNLVLSLMTRFIPLDDKAQRKLFDEPRALLLPFSTKVEIAHLLNMFGAKARDDLMLLSRIRNRFAHYLEVRNFDHREVAPLCDKIHFPKISGWPSPSIRRNLYTQTVSYFVQRFTFETMHAHLPGPHPDSGRLAPDY